jgi:glycosyltransferase involved in cell wall biosynthesis
MEAGLDDALGRPLYFEWGVSTLFGWGIYGLNLLRHWRGVAGAPAYSLSPIDLSSLGGMDALGLRAIAQPLVDSDQMRRHVLEHAPPGPPLDGVVLHSLGNLFAGSTRPASGGRRGGTTAAVIFFEDSRVPDAAAICAEYDVVVTGSTWCERVLRGGGAVNVATVIQGVDPSLFHPAPRAGALAGRFAVFSGGKLERRKGQDLVILAFRAFAERHPEAVLVTGWHSPWPACALSVNANPAVAPVALGADGQWSGAAWALANGLRPEQFIDLGSVPNHLMGRVLREMDVAVFPNRCEGGTNLVAMECLACGVPTIVSNNTGHIDLVATGAPYVLTRQQPMAAGWIGTEGWGESDVEEIVSLLERVWTDRDEAARRGDAGARAMARWNWRSQIGRLHAALPRPP